MKSLVTYLVILFSFVSGTTFAHPNGDPRNAGLGPFPTGETPPGLQKKGISPGLIALDKSPHGWSQGKKEGWLKNHSRRNHGKRHF
jgi:hypothetical protein